jgi:hypothetical protein
MKSDADLISNSEVLSKAEQDAIREQVARLLASSWFRNSKRFPDFLHYTVEHALNGDTDNIKERTLGIEVFGREPAYDTSTDSVVRVTAAEVRKRLAQYYQAPGHQDEVHIDFSLGSYVPEFVFPKGLTPSSTPVVVTGNIPTSVKKPVGRWTLVAAATVFCVLLSGFLWQTYAVHETALDRFWSPIVDSKSPVLLCIPDMSIAVSSFTANPNDGNRPAYVRPLFEAMAQAPIGLQRDKVSFVDSFVLANVASTLGKKGRSFRLFRTEDASLDDLKQGPAVLIGGTNNVWINQVSSTLRFSLADDGPVRYISDRQNASSRQWGLSRQSQPSKVDYAVISRVFNPITGQPVVMAAGARLMGTEAAGECLANPQCLEDAAMLAPGDWEHANIQFVVQAEVINDHPGQPHVLAAYLWQH